MVRPPDVFVIVVLSSLGALAAVCKACSETAVSVHSLGVGFVPGYVAVWFYF